jgi:hypothetical protein
LVNLAHPVGCIEGLFRQLYIVILKGVNIVVNKKPQHTISFLLSKPKRVFTLAEDPDIAPLLAAYGYDAAAREADLAAVTTAEAAVVAQERATGEAQRATVALQTAERAARATFKEFATICRRLALKGDDAALRTLGLHQPTPRKRDEFLTVARTAYENAAITPDILARLVAYGYDAPKLSAIIPELVAVVTAQQAREVAFGVQQLATVAQKGALLDLEERYRKFLALVEVAIKAPQLREKLGLLEPSD